MAALQCFPLDLQVYWVSYVMSSWDRLNWTTVSWNQCAATPHRHLWAINQWTEATENFVTDRKSRREQDHAAPARLARSRRRSGLWVTHFGSVTTYTFCSQHRTAPGFAALAFFISAKQLWLQWQVKVPPRCWEWGSLGCLCRAAIKPGVSVCTHPLAPRGAALLLCPPLSSQTKIFAAIPEREVIRHLYRKLIEKYSSAHSHSSS